MIKSELIAAIGENLAVPKETITDVVNAAIKEIINALNKEGEVTLRGLGSFSVSDKAERMGRNPKTGEDAIITARKVVKFTCSTVLKNHLNQK
jgi:nucleoid DNA-binding protein